MLWRLVAKLLFKACVPLLAIAGVLTYGVYLRGGDPGALWKGVAERGLGQFDTLLSGVRSDTSRAVGAISQSATGKAADQDRGEQTEVFTWKDADGVTHYSTSRPESISVETVRVDPNVNVLAPVRPPERRDGRESAQGVVTDLAIEADGRLPGVAGQVLATREKNAAGHDDITGSANDSMPAVDPQQLLRMLQQAGN